MNRNEEQFGRAYILAALADMVNSGDLDDMPPYGRVYLGAPWWSVWGDKHLLRGSTWEYGHTVRVDTLSLRDLLICYSECRSWVAKRQLLTAELKRHVKDITKRFIND